MFVLDIFSTVILGPPYSSGLFYKCNSEYGANCIIISYILCILSKLEDNYVVCIRYDFKIT
jgi:hypothetical protein